METDPGPFDLIISGGEVVTATETLRLDVAVRAGKIAGVARGFAQPCHRRIDAAGLMVLPGLIDPHVHLRLPMKGTRSSDDVESGTIAALCGGVTTILDFTRQEPGQPLDECLRVRLDEFANKASCDYALHLNVTDFGRLKPEPAGGGDTAEGGSWNALREDLRRARALGAGSLKIFTCYSEQGMAIPRELLPGLLRTASEEGFLVLCHAEDDPMVLAAMNDLAARGRTQPRWFPRSRPPEAEEEAVRWVIAAAAETTVYFVHISTGAAAHAIVKAREQNGPTFFMETCPQYLFLDDSLFTRDDGIRYTVAPPLRCAGDNAALKLALCRGEVDVVATDHCPFRRSQKAGIDFRNVPNGLPGVETRLSLLHTLMIQEAGITWQDIVRMTSTRPADLFDLLPQKGSITVGADADLVLFDSGAQWTVTSKSLHMNTDFSPYEGMPLLGNVRTVILRGQVVVEDGEPILLRRGVYLGNRYRTSA